MRWRRPNEGKVSSRNDRDERFDNGQVGFRAVDYGADDRCSDETDEDEEGAGDTGLGFGEGVGGEDLG